MVVFSKLRSLVLAVVASAGLAGCGEGTVYVAGPAVTVHSQVAYLDLIPTRIGPQTVQLDWSYDPAAYSYQIRRDGFELANLSGQTVIDDSGLFGNRYCYDVLGLSASGRVVSQSPVACISLF